MARAQRGLFDYLADPQEQRYLVLAFEGKLGDEDRERYAAAIEADDPTRAEWLRLERQLHAVAAGDPAIRARFDALCESLSYDWVRVLRRDVLLNCGGARGEPRRVRFAFRCERRWESLAPTEAPGVRACDTCAERVYQCASVREAEAFGREGRCVAVSAEMVARTGSLDAGTFVGRPDPVADWAERIFGADPRSH